MENYIVSARKYRPSTFKSVIGQQSLTHTLKSAIDSNRLAHAYLFCGPRGVGKTSLARIFAKTINCLNPAHDGEACNECESCVAFNEQRSYNIVELDAASNNSIDDIRSLTDQVRVPPQIGKYRVFIIDEVHMLSAAAFNGFLKTLEEPPAHAIFILATTEKHKIIPTILSRCQIYDFSRITIQDIVEQLQYISSQENITTEPAALNVIAQKADGAMRDALSIFDQVAASAMGNITYRSAIESLNVLDYEYYFRLLSYFLEGNVPQALMIYKEIRDHGFDSLFFINGVASHIRDLMVASNKSTVSLLEVSNDVAQQYIEQSAKCTPAFYYKAMEICNNCDLNYRAASNKQFLVELTLIKLCQILNGPSNPEPSKETIKKIETTNQSAPTATPTTAQPQAPQGVASAATTIEPPKVEAPSTQSLVTEKQTTYSAPPKNRTAVAPRVSINPVAQNTTSTSTGDENTANYQRATFSDTKMIEKWNEFANNNPKLVILANTMRTSLPRRIDDAKFEVSVSNHGQLEVFNANISELLAFLRVQLQNDMITLNVNIADSESAPRFLGPTDIVTEMMQKNTAVKNLVDTFKLGLA